jgi:hypothetical protein
MHNISYQHASCGAFGTCSLAPKLPDLPKDLQVAEANLQTSHPLTGCTYCTISTVSSRILKICWPRWPINFLLSSSDLKQGLFFLRVTELTVEMVQYPSCHLAPSKLGFGVCSGL